MKTDTFIRPTNPLTISRALTLFPAPDKNRVQILRPFAVYSARSYSTPITVPIGPAYLAAVLEKAGYRVQIIDGIGEGIRNVRLSEDGYYNLQGLTTQEILDRIDPETAVVGISLMFSQDWLCHRGLINAIAKKYPSLTIVVGGEHPAALPEYLLRDCPAIDYLIAGEGELAFLEFLHAHLTGKDTSAIPGVFSLGSSGRLITNGPANRISDFSNLPRPAWHLCDIENFFTGMWTMGISFGRNMLILATRGCPYQCTFCSSPSMWTTRYMMRPVSDVVDEIEFLIEEYRANSIDFADLTAIIKKEWVLEFCREIKKRNLNFTWQLPSGTRSEALDKEAVEAMYNAGCRFLVYAPESGSQETLESIKKKLNLENIESSIRDAVRIGHTVKVNFVIGFPNESRRLILKTVWANIRMAFLGVTDSNISIFAPYPGSEIFNELRRDGTIKLDDEYFHNLLVQFDFTRQTSVCRHVPSWEIAFYRFAGMGLFYIFSYLLHPKRLWHLVWSLSRLLKKGQGFQANSMFEQRIYEYIKREQLREI